MDKLLTECFVINLKNRVDKLEHFKNELNTKFPIKYCRVNAIEGIQNDIINKFGLKFDSKLNPGEIGCFCSHVSILHYIVENNIQWSLIFEDDVILCNDFQNKFKNIINIFNNQNYNSDIIYLGGRIDPKSLNVNFLEDDINKPSPYYSNPIYKIYPHLLESNELIFMGAFSYCISFKSAKLILNILKIKSIEKPFDLFMTIAHNHNKRSVFYCNPLLTYANDNFKSDIAKYGERYE
jgi:glycosyl transferase family 25